MLNLKKVVVLSLSALWLAASFGMAPNDQSSSSATSGDGPATSHTAELPLNLNPHDVMGVESCEKCHASEVSVWKQTPHSATFLTLHRRPEAQQIADKLGISSFKNDSACIKCHYTMQSSGTGLEAIAGVSCESCHGAAKNWLDVHSDYGGPGVTKQTETAAHRVERLRSSIGAGMRNPINVYMLAQSCYRCHTVPDERLVNVGGHNAGSMDFEIVAWSQGTVRHNFLNGDLSGGDGHGNPPSSPERLRQMFVAGMIADLEFSLRATASATEKATFGVNAAGRSSRAAKRLAAAQSKLKQPLLDEILSVYQGVELKLNNAVQLTQAADSIAALGVRFAATVDGSQLLAIEPYIPSQDRWK